MNIQPDKRCILYCRVSSKEQEERGYSLEAQEKLLTSHAENKGLKISKIFKISESASGKQIRKTFNEMLRFVNKRKINIILCEKIDRLTRNLKDAATVSDWIMADNKREIHFVKENFTVSQNTRAHENLVWDMKVAIARFYTNNLSEEVKKGYQAKLESGWIPKAMKVGYENVGEAGRKMPVPDEMAPHIKRLFELYNTGSYTTITIEDVMYKEGLRGKNGQKVLRSQIHRILIDPFYCGYILWKEVEYDGKHEPIVSEDLFNQVQKKLKRRYKAGQRKKHDHLFKGQVICAECGCLITWETQKGHNYGHCQGYKGCTQKKYLKEEIITDQVIDMLGVIKPKNKQVLEWIKEALKEKHEDKKTYSKATRSSLNSDLDRIEKRLDKIYEDKIDEVITLEYYQKKAKEYNKQKKAVLNALSKMESRAKNYYEVCVEIHDLAFTAKDLIKSIKAKTDDKRMVFDKVFSEMKLNNGKLEITYSPAYQFLSEWMPKLNTTIELSKPCMVDNKTGSFEPARPILQAIAKDVGTFIRSTNGFIFVPSLK